mgnify:FL=1
MSSFVSLLLVKQSSFIWNIHDQLTAMHMDHSILLEDDIMSKFDLDANEKTFDSYMVKFKKLNICMDALS